MKNSIYIILLLAKVPEFHFHKTNARVMLSLQLIQAVLLY